MSTEAIQAALEEMEALLRSYQFLLYNRTDDGWEQIDEKTQCYEDALATLRAANCH